MGKYVKQMFVFAIIFMALFLNNNCKKVEDTLKNKPPANPVNPTPSINELDVSTAPDMSWSESIDPDADLVRYDLYLGTSNPPVLVSSNILINSYTPDTLLPNTKYYWKVVAKDDKNASASSALWYFTTGGPSLPPGNLQVIVCNIAQTNYYGGADVYLYKSDAERTSDPMRTNYFRKATTDNTNPIDVGALFYELSNQKYYVFCRTAPGGGTVLYGVGESFVPGGVNTKLLVFVQ